MTSKGRSKKNEVVVPILGKGSILHGLSIQFKGKVCHICSKTVSHAAFREHVDNCKMLESDMDVEVLEVITPDEKTRRAAANAIILDDDEYKPLLTTTEEDAAENTQDTAKHLSRETDQILTGGKEKESVKNRKSLSTEPTPSTRRRSARLSAVLQSTQSDHIEESPSNIPNQSKCIKRAEGCSQVSKQREDNSIEKTRSSSRKNSHPKSSNIEIMTAEGVPEDAEPTQSYEIGMHVDENVDNIENIFENCVQVEDDAVLSKEIVVEETVEEKTSSTTSGLRKRKAKKPIGDKELSSLDGVTQPDEHQKNDLRTSKRKSNNIDVKEIQTELKGVKKEKPVNTTQNVQAQLQPQIKHESLAGRASLIVRNISAILAGEPSESLDVNVSKAFADQDEDVLCQQGTHYTISFTLRIIKRVLSQRTSCGRLYDESFWEDDILKIEKFVQLSAGAKKLLMRAFLRKKQWMTKQKFENGNEDLGDVNNYLVELVNGDFFETDSKLFDLKQCLQLCSLAQVKEVAKQFQIDHTKGKLDLVSALIERGNTQKSIFGHKGALTMRMVKLTKAQLGRMYQITNSITMILKAIFTLYSPTAMNSSLVIDQPNLNLPQNMLYEMLQVEIRQIRFPAPNPCEEIISIYKDKEALYSYIAAKNIEIEILYLQSLQKFEDAYNKACDARECMFAFSKEMISEWSSLKVQERRFTSLWTLTRCVAHGATLLEKMKRYDEAVHNQMWLLDSPELTSFCINERGAWWDRLVLNLHMHLKQKEDALEKCREGINDPLVGDKDRLLLQDRAKRITNGDFLETILVADPKEKTITARILGKDVGDARVNQFIVENECGDMVPASVEEVVRSHYIGNEGFRQGVHSEGSIWHTVYGLLFYDVINHHAIKGVWLSELQQYPLDMLFPEFYLNRKAVFDDRLKWLKEATVDQITEKVLNVMLKHLGENATDLTWQAEPAEVQSFLSCVSGSLLAAVSDRMIRNYRNTRSGYPDLTMWNSETKSLAVVEVKGPNDRLSTKQRLWLDFFSKQGVRAEVCYVKAYKGRELK